LPGDPLDVDVTRAARTDPASRQMADAVATGIVHRLEHALGRPVLRRVVDRGDDPVECGELVLGDVDLAVRPDVRLDAGENAELRVAGPHRLDLLQLLCEAAVAQ